jgi:hypothetical protein
MNHLGFRPIDPFHLLNSITSSFGTLIATIFSWIYFLAELGVLIGAFVWLLGAAFHHNGVKRTGAHMILYAIIGFLAAVILPGVIVAINSYFHHM